MKRLIRRRPSPALVIACLALFAALGPVAYGSHLGSLLIGHPNTAGNNSTSLQGNHAGKLLQLTNNSTAAGSTALGLTVGAGRTPFTVNSSTKVANLNADRLDGVDSTGFLRTTGKAADADMLDGVDSTDFLRTTGKAADADMLDGLDSSGFVRGPGRVIRGAVALGPVNGVNFTVMQDDPFFRIGYLCPDPVSNNGVFRLNNRTGETVNLFIDNGGVTPEYVQLGPGGVADRFALAAGEWIHMQIHSPSQGIADISMFSAHRTSDCHIQAQATISN